MGKLSVDQFHNNVMLMLNLLHDAESKFLEGPSRDKAYAAVGQELLGDPLAFADLA